MACSSGDIVITDTGDTGDTETFGYRGTYFGSDFAEAVLEITQREDGGEFLVGTSVLDFEGFWDMPGGFTFNMGFRARFDSAAVEWDMKGGRPLTVYLPDGTIETPSVGDGDAFRDEIAYFLDCLANNRQPRRTTAAESREAVRIALAERRSIEIGTPVPVKEAR